MRKRLLITAVVLLLLAGVGALLWNVFDWPPPRVILEYGPSPAGEPTGRVRSFEIERVPVEFVEVGPGWIDLTPPPIEKGDLLGRIFHPLGIEWGEAPLPAAPYVIEMRRPFWIMPEWLPDRIAKRYLHFGMWQTPMDPEPVGPGWIMETLELHRLCEALAAREGGEFGLPSREEFDYCTELSFLRADQDHGDPVIFGSIGNWESCRSRSRSQGFRLVWIPPGDEE